MKRFFRRLVTRFSKLTIEDKIAYIAALMVAVATLFSFFSTTDMIAATTLDYRELHQKIDEINQNPEAIFNHECKVTVSSRNIIVYLENEECKVTATFNKNIDLISIDQEDKAYSWIYALFSVLILTVIFAAIAFWFTGTVVILIKTFSSIRKRKDYPIYMDMNEGKSQKN